MLKNYPEDIKEKLKKYIKPPEMDEFFVVNDELIERFLNFCVSQKILKESEKREILMERDKMEKVKLELKKEILSLVYGRDKAHLLCLKDDNYIKVAMKNFDKAEKICEDYYQE